MCQSTGAVLINVRGVKTITMILYHNSPYYSLRNVHHLMDSFWRPERSRIGATQKHSSRSWNALSSMGPYCQATPFLVNSVNRCATYWQSHGMTSCHSHLRYIPLLNHSVLLFSKNLAFPSVQRTHLTRSSSDSLTLQQTIVTPVVTAYLIHWNICLLS